MDAGLAALIGTAIGGALGAGGVLGAAWLTGRLQTSGQHAQWRLEGRREVYGVFLSAAVTYLEGVAVASAAVSVEKVRTADERAKELLDALHRALPAVAIEGPEAVASAAKGLTRAADDIDTAVGFYVLSAVHGTSSGNSVAEVAELLKGAKKHIDHFALCAREALDMPNIVRKKASQA